MHLVCINHRRSEFLAANPNAEFLQYLTDALVCLRWVDSEWLGLLPKQETGRTRHLQVEWLVWSIFVTRDAGCSVRLRGVMVMGVAPAVEESAANMSHDAVE